MKKNGFVFMETIVVISILSITLILLFASYSQILRKSREKNTFDTLETIYKTYYIKDIIDEYQSSKGLSGNSVQYFVNNSGECNSKSFTGGTSFICDFSKNDYNGYLKQAKLAYEVDKIYYLNPNKIVKSPDANTWLNTFDATTIDYILDVGDSTDYNILLVKYKKKYSDGTYEVIHSSMEVG